MPREPPNPNRPPAPEYLDGEALLEWQRVVDELEAMDALATADRSVIELYARTWATWHAAQTHVERHGSVVMLPNNWPGTSPQYNVALALAKQLRTLLNDIGLTPSTRRADVSPGKARMLDFE